MREKYKLLVSWSGIEYLGNGIIKLVGARFFGGALKIASHIDSNDSIRLDITSQCIEVLNGWEIAILKWGLVRSQTSLEVLLDDVFIVSDKMASARLLSNSDILAIDTENHEGNKHVLNFVYRTLIVNSDSYIHTYRG